MTKQFTMTQEEHKEWLKKLVENPALIEKYCGLKFYEDGFGYHFIENFKTMWLRHSNLWIKLQMTMKQRHSK
jgi:hypothetical protein